MGEPSSESRPEPIQPKQGRDEAPLPPRPEQRSVTRHEIELGGHTLAYTATAATLNLRDERGADRASVFYVAFTLDGARDDRSRPITFAFNGGPGSSSVWLQLGALGPKRVELPDAAVPPPPPYRLVDNAESILDATDLVFIDPVSTGFSRPIGEARGKDYHGVKEDVASIAEFIRRYLDRTHRWNAPRFLAGESYGSTRGAALARHLQEQGIVLNGLVLLSVALDFQSFIFEAGNDLPYLLFLPTYAATAWHHHRLPDRPDDLDALLEEVRGWAIETYAPALLRGSALPEAEQVAVAGRLARYTGLEPAAIRAMNLRVEAMRFAKMVLGRPGHTVGRLDSRYTGPDADPQSPTAERDPSYDAPLGPFTALINDYLRGTLRFETTDGYEVLSVAVNESWRWGQGKRFGYINVVEDLRRALIANPHLRVLIANGLFDLATPFFAAEHAADHLGVEPTLRENVKLTYYPAGHMMYLHGPSRAQLRRDLLAFYQDALVSG